MVHHLTSEPAGELGNVALDRHVEVRAILTAEREVPHGAADQKDASVTRGDAQRIQVQPRHPRKQPGDLYFDSWRHGWSRSMTATSRPKTLGRLRKV